MRGKQPLDSFPTFVEICRIEERTRTRYPTKVVLHLPSLPYNTDALEPYMSRFALDMHYRILHQGYIDKLNAAIPDLDPRSDLLKIAHNLRCEGREGLYRAASQAWNHGFFWNSMRVATGATESPDGILKDIIRREFGGLANLREEFISKGLAQFASGWVWLCLDEDQNVEVVTTPDADNPALQGKSILLVCDIWEHSYYPNYGPDREYYLSTWFDMLANFEFASNNARMILTGFD